MKIELPWPDPKLNPNQSKGRHWSVASGARKTAREAAYWLARSALIENVKNGGPGIFGDVSLCVQITFLAPDRRSRDLDNLLAALKPSLDGIADCLGTDDSKFDPIMISRGYCGGQGRVTVEVSQ